MGIKNGKIIAEGNADFDSLQLKQKKFEKQMSVPLSIQVAHFTPASFPLVPVINRHVNKLCSTSWNSLVEQEFEGENGTSVAGITIFYHEFYKRLAMFDNKGMFEAVLSRHSGSANKVAVKGAILVRIIKFVLSIQEDCEEVQLSLYVLGKSHQQKQIRPWQYTVFIETLLNTLSAQLGVGATADVMHAWVNLFAFVLQSMLPPAIEGLTLANELNVNTSSIFDVVDTPSPRRASMPILPFITDKNNSVFETNEANNFGTENTRTNNQVATSFSHTLNTTQLR